MAVRAFPPVELADDYGLLAVGGDLEVSSLLLAYESGIFPWPLPGEERITWFAPPKRAVLFVDEFKVSKSLIKAVRQGKFELKFDNNFNKVTAECASLINRRGQKGTWITDDIIQSYGELFKQGHAYSIECYESGDLVGGIYGVIYGGMCSGESMFYRSPNASKIALYALTRYLKSEGVEWIDCQVLNPHLATLGVREIPREEFMELLALAVNRPKIQLSNEKLQTILSQLVSGE